MNVLDSVASLLGTEPTWRDPNPERSHVTAIEHALQAATRAQHAQAPDVEVVMALVHDAARPIAEVYHGEVIAFIVRDRVPYDVFMALFHHGVFQADLIHGTYKSDLWRNFEWYATARRLAQWDWASFDASYDSLPLAHFRPVLERVLSDQQ